jgi:hypothetical protein
LSELQGALQLRLMVAAIGNRSKEGDENNREPIEIPFMSIEISLFIDISSENTQMNVPPISGFINESIRQQTHIGRHRHPAPR